MIFKTKLKLELGRTYVANNGHLYLFKRLDPNSCLWFKDLTLSGDTEYMYRFNWDGVHSARPNVILIKEVK